MKLIVLRRVFRAGVPLVLAAACGSDGVDIDDLNAAAIMNAPVPEQPAPGIAPPSTPGVVTPTPGMVPATPEPGMVPATPEPVTPEPGMVPATPEPVVEPPPEPVVPPEPEGPYAPRNGAFKILAYSKTSGFRHRAAITEGREMLERIGSLHNFEVVTDESNEYFTAEGLSQFELVFMLNPTGDAMGNNHQRAFEEWMADGGAMAGTHSATDFERDWDGYKEYTMQYYDRHGNGNDPNAIVFTDEGSEHPAIVGLPSPWSRRDEWYRFLQAGQWGNGSTPGLTILGRLQRNASGGNAPPANQPIMWAREWDTFRVFYTALGHDGDTYNDENFEKHITGGIMWAVRREHLLDQ